MSQPEHYAELTRLLSGLLDGRLSSEEQARLEQWLARDSQARRLYMQFVDMEVEFSSPMQAAPASLTVGKPPARRRRRIAIAAAAILLLGLGALGLWLGKRTRQDLSEPVLAEVQGDVRIVSRGEQPRPGSAGAELRPGDAIQLSDEKSSAQLTLPGGIQLTLLERASLTLEDPLANALALAEGKLEAAVEPQPEGRELVITTPRAKVQVVGTRFTLKASAEETALNVQEGRVRITRLSDSKGAEVKAGKSLLVKEGVDLMEQDLSEPPLIWHADFEDGLPSGWVLGEWTGQDLPPGSRGGVRAARAPMPDADDRRAWQVVSQKPVGGLFAFHADAHLHFTYRMARPGAVRLTLVTRESAGEAAWTLELEGPPWDVPAGRWHTASVPLSAFRELAAVKGIVSYIVFSSGIHDRGLAFDRIWVTRGGPGRVRSVPVP